MTRKSIKKVTSSKKKNKKSSFKKGFTISLILFLLISLSLTSFYFIRKHNKKYRYPDREYANKKKWFFSEKDLFKSRFVYKEVPFVVIIPSYNNENFCAKNLNSVLTQDYHNFRVIYIDDHSTDHTYEIVKEVVGQNDKVQLIHNVERKGAMENLYKAVHSCKDDEIAVILDGDDWLSNDLVLQKLNEAYANPRVWLTYGQYLEYPHFRLGCSRPLMKKMLQKERGMRDSPWITSHLKTFYVRLFKKIKLGDFLYEGKFLPMASDLAFMIPMLEMARKHSLFITDILYMYNVINPLNDAKVDMTLQERCADHLKSFPSYPTLQSISPEPPSLSAKNIDFIIFSCDRPLQLYACLESIHRYAQGFHRIWVIYRASDSEFAAGYEALSSSFENVHFIKQSKRYKEDFKPLVMETLFGEKGEKSPYVIFGVDDDIMKDFVNLEICVDALEKTKAYSFHLRLGKHLDFCYMQNRAQPIPESVSCASLTMQENENFYAWQFKKGTLDWDYPHTVDMALYRKEDIRKDLEETSFSNPNTFEGHWAERADHEKIGLYFENSKLVNIPLNQVNPSENRSMESYTPSELLALFNKGLKIDIKPFHKIDNHSPHVEKELSFVYRDF